METGTLYETVNVTLDANGRGEGRLAPGQAGVVWRVTRITTYGSSDPEPTLRVYRNLETPTTMTDNTKKANSDVSETQCDVRSGESLLFVYESGNPGDIMGVRIEGTWQR